MKRFVWVAALAGLLIVAVASTAFAAPAEQRGMGPGSGIHAPGTGLSATGTGACPCGSEVRRGAPAWAGQPDEVAALLHMSEAQIQAERQAGKSLVQIAAAKDVSEQELVDTILAARKTALDGQVADGKLSQAQADYMYSHMQAQIKAMVNRTTTGPAWSNGSNAGAGMGRGAGGRWNQ